MQNERLKKLLDERSLLLSKEKSKERQKEIEEKKKDQQIQAYRNYKITADTGDRHSTCTITRPFPPITECEFIPYQTTTDCIDQRRAKFFS